MVTSPPTHTLSACFTTGGTHNSMRNLTIYTNCSKHCGKFRRSERGRASCPLVNFVFYSSDANSSLCPALAISVAVFLTRWNSLLLFWILMTFLTSRISFKAVIITIKLTIRLLVNLFKRFINDRF